MLLISITFLPPSYSPVFPSHGPLPDHSPRPPRLPPYSLFTLSDRGAGEGPTGPGERCFRRRSSPSEDRLAATGSSRRFTAGENHR